MREKKTVIGILLAAVMLMAVGYAAFATNLVINGTANIESTWKVIFTDITKVSKTGGVTEKSTPTASGTSATFDIDLTSPGDKIEYRITVANQGNLDAIIESINATETGSDAITFEITNIKIGDSLLANSTTTFNVIISYNENITTQPEKSNNKLTININYVQNLGQDIDSTVPEINKQQPTRDNLYGVWLFNETLTGLDKFEIDFVPLPPVTDVSFISNNISYFGIHNGSLTGPVSKEYDLYYETDEAYSYSDGWLETAYRTVDFGTEGQKVSRDFFEWLLQNAVYQG